MRTYARTEWRRPIVSPKLQIIFHKRATKHRSLLRKKTYKDTGFYESSPPCALYIHVYRFIFMYGVATISRLLKIIGLFCTLSSV